MVQREKNVIPKNGIQNGKSKSTKKAIVKLAEAKKLIFTIIYKKLKCQSEN